MGYNSGINHLYQGISARDVENLAKYATGAAIVETSEGPFEGFIPMLCFPGIMYGASWALGNYAHPIEGLKQIPEDWNKFIAESKKEFDTIKKAGNLADSNTYRIAFKEYNLKKIKECIPEAEKLQKLTPEVQNFYKQAEAAMLKGNVTEAEKLIAEARSCGKYFEEAAKGFWGKIGRFFSEGSRLGTKPLSNLAKESGIARKFMTCGKGAGFFAAMTAIFEVFKIGSTYSELGAGSATKQTVKSVVKTGANVGGWFAGEAAGTAVGAAIGTAVCPVVGTAVGAGIGFICGLVGGFLGSWGAGKVADALVGKDELDIAKEKQAKKIAQQAKQSPETMQQVVSGATQRLQQEGLSSADSKIAFGSLRRLGIDPEQAQSAQTQAVNQPMVASEDSPTNGTQSLAMSPPNPMLLNQNNLTGGTSSLEDDFMNPFKRGVSPAM